MTRLLRPNSVPLLALLGGAVGISFASIFAKMANQNGQVAEVASAFWRMALAFPVLLGVTLLLPRARREFHGLRPAHLVLLAVPGLFFALDLASWHLSFAWTTAASATLLANVGVVLVGLTGWLVLKERLDQRFLLGALLALGGVAWLVLGTSGPTHMPHQLRGDVLALLTAVFYASYIVSIKLIRRRSGAMVLLLMSTATATVILAGGMWIEGGRIMPVSTRGWVDLALLALVPQCIGQGLIVYALASLPAAFSAITLLIQPVLTAVWGWVLLDEALGLGQMSAGCVVLIGIVLARLGSGTSTQQQQARTP